MPGSEGAVQGRLEDISGGLLPPEGVQLRQRRLVSSQENFSNSQLYSMYKKHHQFRGYKNKKKTSYEVNLDLKLTAFELCNVDQDAHCGRPPVYGYASRTVLWIPIH